MLGDWNGQRTAQQQQGYDFGLGYTGEMAALLDAKHASSRGTEYADQFAFGAPLDLEKILGWRGAEAQLTVADFRCLKRAFEFCAGSLGARPNLAPN
jgi:porin